MLATGSIATFRYLAEEAQMSIVLKVNYRLASDVEAQLRRDATQAGLDWEIPIGGGRRGGVYFFDDKLSAGAWQEGFSRRIAKAGGSQVTFRSFEVNETSSAAVGRRLVKLRRVA
jgi:hypothetical protein